MNDAVTQLAALLVSPEQLDKVETLRESTKRKQASIDAQLQAGVQRQMEEARVALQLLEKSEGFVGELRGSFSSIEALCKHCQELLPQYPVMKRLHLVRENLHKCQERAQQLSEIPEKVSEVHEMLEDDRNVLLAHETIHELQELRTLALIETKEYPDEHSNLKRQFAELDGLAEQLEIMLFKVIGEVLNMSQRRPATLVKAFQVVEREEKYDRKRMQRNAVLEEGLNNGTISKADAAKQREIIGGFKRLTFDRLRTWILQHFDFAFATLEADLKIISVDEKEEEEDDVVNIAEILSGTVENVTERILDEAEEMFKELDVVKNFVVACAPPKYNLFDFFVREYHLQYHLLITRFANQKSILSAKDTLLLVNWVKNKYEPLLKKLGYSDIEPSVIEPLAELMANYRRHIRTLMDDWTPRIIAADRAAPPDPIQGLYYTGGPVTLFKILNQQLIIGNSTGYPKMMFEVVLECQSCLHSFQQCIQEMLEEQWEELEFEYIIALINNSRKSIELLDKYTKRVFEILSPQFADLISFAVARDNFEHHASLAQHVLAKAIFRDMEEHMARFGTKEWVKDPESLMDAICDTFFDFYLNHVEGFVLDSTMASLHAEGLDLVVASFLRAFMEVTKVKQPPVDSAFVERYQEEERILRKFSCKYMRESKVDDAIAAISGLGGLLLCQTSEQARAHTVRLKMCSAVGDLVTRDNIDRIVSRRVTIDKRAVMQGVKDALSP